MIFAVSIGLMYIAGLPTAPGRAGGAATAVLFALTPVLWLLAAQAPAALLPVPFVAGWILAVGQWRPDRSPWWPAVAGACLGAGVYSSYAAVVMMPVLLVLTVALAAHARAFSPRGMALMIVAFVVALGPLAAFLIRHPNAFRDTVNAFHLYDANRFNPRQGVREMASWVGLTARSEVYYDYFNPAFLFMTGRTLLFPLAVLLPAGLWQIVSDETTLIARLSMAGFLVSPFAASLTAAPPVAHRLIFMVPFAALVSTYGLKRLMAWRSSFAAESSRSERLQRP